MSGISTQLQLLQDRAREFAAKDLKQTSFTASNGWLECLKKRHNIVYGKLSWESGDVDAAVVADWEDRLETLKEGYAP